MEGENIRFKRFKEKISEKKLPELPELPEKEKLPENVAIVETPKADFRIIYRAAHHVYGISPETLGNNYDGVFLEKMGDYSVSEESEEMVKQASKLKDFCQIVEKAKKEKKPIFFGDLITTEGYVFSQLQYALKKIETSGVVLYPLLSLAREIEMDWLKSTLIGGYLGTHLAEDILGVRSALKEGKIPRKLRKFLITLNERVHPETHAIVLTLRNYLFAQKMYTIPKMLEKEGKKPELAIVIGGAHSGIEKALRTAEKKRLKRINWLTKTPGLRKERERIATVGMAEWIEEKKGWKTTILKDPGLLPIEEREKEKRKRKEKIETVKIETEK